MASSATNTSNFSEDRHIWDSLKQAIAASSGFQNWQREQSLGNQRQGHSLDQQVRWYLRETLETLAY
ncbi:MAG: hypothetical protein KME06_17720 [Kastovskya adunca ATA6-11-RM4]|jgi:hypothetical protein|nr:hypothetical protein [Kastovskya adunca ATA6-11-RM4]